MEENNNEIEEYERLFGNPSKVDLFDEGEDYYNGLRQVIINTPNNYIANEDLPFSNVEILPYFEFLLMEEVNKAKALGRRVFFLKQSSPCKEDFCFAAGFYENRKKTFTILKYSRIAAKVYFDDGDVYLQKKRNVIIHGKAVYEEGVFLLNTDIVCQDPRIGACIVTGQRTEMDKWRDSNKRPLTLFYNDIELSSLNAPIIYHSITDTNKEDIKKDSKKHYFYIISGQYINAYGYYDPETNYFYIGKGSTIEQYFHGISMTSELAKNRKRMIDKVGAKQLFCWKLLKDAKCKNAEVAASYVLGRISSFDKWHDDDGNTLDIVYPEQFKRNEEPSSHIKELLEIHETLEKRLYQEENHRHYFYIRKHTKSRFDCDASGFYDPYSKSFVLLKDSIFSIETTSLFNYSAVGVQRRLFIKKNCVLQNDGYRLKCDINFLTPSQAASYVLGCSSQLGLEWLDTEGRTLLEVYN